MDTHAAPLPDDGAETAVNHAGGIARLMGDSGLFERVLARFRNEYRQAAAGIRAALDHGDTPLALRLVHTLKGAAGMIEAVPLRRQAHALEQALRNDVRIDDGAAYRAVTQLENELGRVLRELDALASTLPARSSAPAPAAAAPTASERENALERLVALLDEGNGDAVDLVRDAAPALTAQLGDAHYRAVAALIDAFDFDGALALLQARITGS
jgi:HPt (histidine-containing phosphotransfer) domain-containing protein